MQPAFIYSFLGAQPFFYRHWSNLSAVARVSKMFDDRESRFESMPTFSKVVKKCRHPRFLSCSPLPLPLLPLLPLQRKCIKIWIKKTSPNPISIEGEFSLVKVNEAVTASDFSVHLTRINKMDHQLFFLCDLGSSGLRVKQLLAYSFDVLVLVNVADDYWSGLVTCSKSPRILAAYGQKVKGLNITLPAKDLFHKIA